MEIVFCCKAAAALLFALPKNCVPFCISTIRLACGEIARDCVTNYQTTINNNQNLFNSCRIYRIHDDESVNKIMKREIKALVYSTFCSKSIDKFI